MITLIRKVDPAELDGAFLWDFDNYQCYHRMWVKKDGQWSLERTSAVRQWNDEKKLQITRYLAWLIKAGGHVFGAYAEGRLVGFLTLDKEYGGSREQYLNLSMLFVDSRYKRRGVGKYLFDESVKEAASLGAEKLFISAIPAEETVAFYFAMGCRDADEIISEWVDMPYDRYLEYQIEPSRIKPKPKKKPEPEKEPESKPAPEPEAAPEPIPETEPGTASEPAPEPGTTLEPTSEPETSSEPILKTKAEVKTDEESATGSVLRQRRRRDRGAQGKRRPGGAEQRSVPRRSDPHARGADRRQAGDGHEDHDHSTPS